MKRVGKALVICTIFILMISIIVSANSGTGMEADEEASIIDSTAQVYCIDDLEIKEYIGEQDRVLRNLAQGTIFTMDGKLLRSGRETGWGTTLVKDEKSGGFGNGFFMIDQVDTYAVPNPIEVENTEDEILTIRVPVYVKNETFEWEASDETVLEMLTCETTEEQYVISFLMKRDSIQDAEVKIYGHDEAGAVAGTFTITIYTAGDSFYALATEAPLTYSEIVEKTDHNDVLYMDNGDEMKVTYLKDGRVIDSNGYVCVRTAENEYRLHNGNLVYALQKD